MKKTLLFLLTTISIFTLVSCKQIDVPNDDTPNDTPTTPINPDKNTNDETKTKLSFEGSDLKIGLAYEILGNVERNIPQISDEGNRYPTYGTSLDNITDEEKTALINESNYLKASDSTYNKIDKDGNLYLNDTILERKLYKHTTSLNTYYGTPSDDEAAVSKRLTISAREVGNHVTGLYAPAGEVITITLSNEDLSKTGGVKIEMGQYSQNNELNNIWVTRNDFSRMPLLGNEMLANEETTYVATFLGGPIYVTPIKQCDFTITISGALEYTHFIYGLTTKDEFERLKGCSAPYFDLEVWDSCVRHSGPKKYANLDYDNLNQISNFWLSVSNISKQIPAGSRKTIGIDFIYDPFVAAGSAVAFVGRNWCNLPPDWMSGALDYEGFTTNGSWGPIHEYNHHFQRYGFNPGDEVTNNALSLLSYINYTKISENRDNLRDWNRYLNPKVSLNETLNQSSSTTSPISSLNTYADIIHTFGVDTFIKACNYKNGGGGSDNWYESLCETTGHNMEYYFSLLHQEVSESLKQKYSKLPMFIPATINEQTGKVINGSEIITVLPYVVDPTTSYVLDLDKSLTLPEGFSYKIKNIISPTYTNYTTKNNKINISTKNNSKLLINLELTNDDITSTQTFVVELLPKFIGINYEKYSYDTKTFTSCSEAIAKNFEGYTNKIASLINTHFVNGVSNKEIASYYGKVYMPKDGEYKISVGTSNRSDTLLELGLNTSSYTDIIDSPKNNPINYNDKYITYNVKNGDYIYFRITINSNHQDGFAELFGGYDKLTSINSTYLFNNQTTKSQTFKINDRYKREYNSTSFTVPLTNQKIIDYSESYSKWDDSFKIENILDGNSSTSYHSVKNKFINTEPFELTIDLGANYFVNTLNITTYNGNQAHYPTFFTLYGGTTLDDLKKLKVVENQTVTNKNLSVSFDTINIRYYKIVITNTSEQKYVAISDINMALTTNGKQISPKNALYYIDDNQTFEKKYTSSTFGYTIKGNGEIEIEATNSFGIITKDTNAKITITIDDKEQIVEFDKIFYIDLKSLKKIKIKILNELEIDSFII